MSKARKKALKRARKQAKIKFLYGEGTYNSLRFGTSRKCYRRR